MIGCVDVDYRNNDSIGIAACILFENWSADKPKEKTIKVIKNIAPYQSGQFYKRELPCITEVIYDYIGEINILIIDGYVWLSESFTPGLGAHLFKELNEKIAIIGVAKRPFRNQTNAIPIIRGKSKKPLYITAAGIDISQASLHIQFMHGENRIPTLIRLTDQICRSYQAHSA